MKKLRITYYQKFHEETIVDNFIKYVPDEEIQYSEMVADIVDGLYSDPHVYNVIVKKEEE